MFGLFEYDSGTLNPHAVINHDYSNSKKNNYTVRPPTFSGDSTEFEWWEINMYTHIIGLVDKLLDIIEDGIDILVNGVIVVSDRKTLTPTRKRSI